MSKFYKRNSRAAKATPEIVQQIRQLYASGRYTQGQLSRAFHISVNQIGRIVRGESWQSMPLPEPTAADMDEMALRSMRVYQAAQVAEGKQINPMVDEPAEVEREGVLERLQKELRNRNADVMLEELTKQNSLPKTPVKPEVADRAREFLDPNYKPEKK